MWSPSGGWPKWGKEETISLHPLESPGWRNEEEVESPGKTWCGR